MLKLWHPLLRGGIPAVITIAFSLMLGQAGALGFYAIVLGVTAGVYLGFAVLDGRPRVVALEIAGVLFFILLALMGLQSRPYLLALGFLLHIGWDYAHHPRGLQTAVAPWYAHACVVYDGLVGLFILYWWR